MEDILLFTANHDFTPQSDIEHGIVLNRGDTIEAKRSENQDLTDDLASDQWIVGTNRASGQYGYFPSSFVSFRPKPKPRPTRTSGQVNDSGYVSPYSNKDNIFSF